MLWRGDDGSLMYETGTVDLESEWFKCSAIALACYMTDGRVIMYHPEPLRLPPPRDD